LLQVCRRIGPASTFVFTSRLAIARPRAGPLIEPHRHPTRHLAILNKRVEIADWRRTTLSLV
jgi:hypothetical protein